MAHNRRPRPVDDAPAGPSLCLLRVQAPDPKTTDQVCLIRPVRYRPAGFGRVHQLYVRLITAPLVLPAATHQDVNAIAAALDSQGVPATVDPLAWQCSSAVRPASWGVLLRLPRRPTPRLGSRTAAGLPEPSGATDPSFGYHLQLREVIA